MRSIFLLGIILKLLFVFITFTFELFRFYRKVSPLKAKMSLIVE